MAVKPLLGRKPYDVLGQRHRGYVRRFAERWGFLNAAAFDGDLFVHRDNLLLEPLGESERQRAADLLHRLYSIYNVYCNYAYVAYIHVYHILYVFSIYTCRSYINMYIIHIAIYSIYM